MKLFISFVLLLSCSCTYSYAQQDTVALDSYLNVLPDFSYAQLIGVRTKIDKKHTQLNAYTLDGKLSRAITYSKFSDRYQERQIDGRCVWCYDNGKDSLVMHFSKDKYVGYDTVYYKNGGVWFIKKENTKSAHFWQYWPNGKLKREQRLAKLDRYGEAIYKGKCFDEAGNEVEFSPYETNPKYPGDVSLQQLISKDIRYPQGAIIRNKEGVVIVRFVIDVDGRCIDSKIVRSSGDKLLDEEVARVANKLTQDTYFIPAKIDDVPIRAGVVIPINYIIKTEQKPRNGTTDLEPTTPYAEFLLRHN
ncbi:MAG: TonB family protein [Marinilabiliaceae bacterium]|nr:TonB family protein [Marinilabiliaceae bacterium]